MKTRIAILLTLLLILQATSLRDALIARAGSPTDPLAPAQWALDRIAAAQAWEAPSTDSSINVAVIDSGVDLQHEDLQCPGKLSVIEGSDVVDDGSGPQDVRGTGTHSAGIIGACTNNGIGIAGVAPGATIMPFQVLRGSGSASFADIATGIRRATDAQAHVIHISFVPSVGPLAYVPGAFAQVEDAIRYAASAGVVVVAPAGNDGLPLCETPGLREEVLCVGATDARDLKAWYSASPAKKDTSQLAITAPGGTEHVICGSDAESVLSLIPVEFDRCEDGRTGYGHLNGTAVATAHVAGAAALVYGRLGATRSVENWRKVVQGLIYTANDLGAPGYDPVFGFGRLNAALAVDFEGPRPSVNVQTSSIGKGFGAEWTCMADATGGYALWTEITECSVIDHADDKHDAGPVRSPGSHVVAKGSHHILGGLSGPQVCWNASAEFLGGWIDSVSGCQRAVSGRGWPRFYDDSGDVNGNLPSNEDIPVDIAINPTGTSVFVTGWSRSGDRTNGIGLPKENIQMRTIAYDRDGRQRWVGSYSHASGRAVPEDVAVSRDGSTVFVAGLTDEGLGSHDVTQPAGTVLIAYNAVTGRQLWTAHPTTSWLSSISSNFQDVWIDATSSGRVMVGVGKTVFAYAGNNGVQLWSSSLAHNVEGLRADHAGSRVFVVGPYFTTTALDATNGAVKWLATYPGRTRDLDFGHGLTVAPNDAYVYVIGQDCNAPSSDACDFATVAYDATTGMQRWAARYGGLANKEDDPQGVAVSPDGSKVYVTGWTDFNHATTIAYAADTGTQLWLTQPPGRTYGTGRITVTADGSRVYTLINDSTGPTEDHWDAVIGYDPSGAEVWRRIVARGTSENATSFALSPDASTIFVTGTAARGPHEWEESALGDRDYKTMVVLP